METVTTYKARDGRTFKSEKECETYEAKLNEFRAIVESKIGEHEDRELRLGGPHGRAVLNSLPYTAPWMSAFGACLVMVTDLRRNDAGEVEFQIPAQTVADENAKQDREWVKSESFYGEWPK